MDFLDIPSEAIDQNPLTTWHEQYAQEKLEEYEEEMLERIFDPQYMRLSDSDRDQLVALQLKIVKMLGFTCNPYQLWEQYLNFRAQGLNLYDIIQEVNTTGDIKRSLDNSYWVSFVRREEAVLINPKGKTKFSAKYGIYTKGNIFKYFLLKQQDVFSLDTKEGTTIQVEFKQEDIAGTFYDFVALIK